MPKTIKNNCPGDENAYVEFDSGSKIFRAVVQDVEFFDTPTALTHVKVDFNRDEARVELSFVISDNQSVAKNQASEFQNLVGKLNATSFLNQFYLSRTDFFQKQCKHFVGLTSNASSEKKSSITNPHESNSHNGNFAF
ncbi:hypothetical protein [Legionella sp. PC997]|uniref:hypothetical protein n=1 Tax=Legionella sp. PC997 TaxID=2755562 RepID=UPI0015FBA0C9|nr:hypothetical protein [Legionella sp. PC997]QMT59148.1 hypothetical protein HBNCFIEN_00509 [Legionella sp. PC997]